MTRGRGGVLANDDVITGTTIFGKCLDFSKNFSKIFLRIYKILTKLFNFSRKFLLKLMLSLCGVWDLLTKLHRSSWMSDVLPSTPRPFLKSWGFLHRQVLGQRIQFQRSIFCPESLAVHTAVACVWLVAS